MDGSTGANRSQETHSVPGIFLTGCLWGTASVKPNPNPEHNFGYHEIGPSTAFSVDNWPRSVPIVFLGWEVGNKIQTGGVMTKGSKQHR